MPTITIITNEGEIKKITLSQGETVLSGLLREGYDVPYGCRSGVCHSCILRSSSTNLPRDCQKGLAPVDVSQGYFLSCNCKPASDIEVSLAANVERYDARIESLEQIAADIWKLRLEKVIAYRPGQYITLKHKTGVTRSYSIASHPTEDDFIECHIRVYPDGKFSDLIQKELTAGDTLQVLGPYGNCIYDRADQDKTLFLVGSGTGLSPLYGVIREALTHGHRGRVVVLIAALDASRLYFTEEMAALKRRFANLEIHYSIQNDNAEFKQASKAILPISDVYQKAAEIFPDLSGCKVYLCGAQSFVQRLRKESFLRGANMSDIRADEFLRAVA